MSENQLQALKHIIEYSEEMLEMALTERWVSVSERQAKRDILIKAFFSQELSLEAEVVAQNIKQILTIDSQITELVNGYKNELQSELKKIVNGKSAVKAYANF